MPRRNIWILSVLTVACIACRVRAHRSEQVLTYAIGEVEARALEKVESQKLFEGALEGMMAAVGDPHSTYINPKMLKEFEQTINPEFGGVGIEIVLDPDTKQLTVASPLYGTPAFESGIRPQDRIVKIDGKATQGMSLEDASVLMKGKPGSLVELSVLHYGEEKPVSMRITRAVIQVDTVLGDVRNPDGSWNYFLEGHNRVGYIRINTFSEKTGDEMEKALRRLVDGGAKGLVLDLRYDPGGLLSQAVRICDMFIEDGVIVTTRDRYGDIDRKSAKGDPICPDLPMAILVNNLTASASEIVAACLQDHGRAVVVGQRTFGKGTVQELIKLPGEEGILKLTVASYWRPSEKNINRGKDAAETDEWGVSPDPGLAVKLEGKELKKLNDWRRDYGLFRISGQAAKSNGGGSKAKRSLPTDVDPQLKKAVEYVEQKATAK